MIRKTSPRTTGNQRRPRPHIAAVLTEIAATTADPGGNLRNCPDGFW
jgi:hypothetical protein